VVERGNGLGLALEPVQPDFVGGKLGRQDLEGDVAAQLRIAGAIDDTHPAGANDADDFKTAQPAACGQHHRGDAICSAFRA
jgi:hypothetical protein